MNLKKKMKIFVVSQENVLCENDGKIISELFKAENKKNGKTLAI